MGENWVKWHGQYDDPKSPMQRRLSAVQERLASALRSLDEECPRLLSLCAGDGRDVIPVLAALPPGRSCRATLVELSPALAERARTAADAAGLDVSVLVADAGDPNCYATGLPVDVLLLCGIFGNVADDDIHTTIESAGGLVRRDGWIIWTRHRRSPDLTPVLRRWFADAGFEEVGFDSPGIGSWSVGTCINRSARHRTLDSPLFTFTR